MAKALSSRHHMYIRVRATGGTTAQIFQLDAQTIESLRLHVLRNLFHATRSFIVGISEQEY